MGPRRTRAAPLPTRGGRTRVGKVERTPRVGSERTAAALAWPSSPRGSRPSYALAVTEGTDLAEAAYSRFRNHCGECNRTLSGASEAFCDLQSPASVALKVPSFLRREFPYVLSRPHSWKCFLALSWELSSHSYCAVKPSLTCYLLDRVPPSL